eukprot:4467134-Alexandrium_andersonii.AAC.1
MTETSRREANPPPQGPFRALSEPPPEGHRTMGGAALTEQLGVPRNCAPSCPVRAPSPIVRRPSKRALK